MSKTHKHATDSKAEKHMIDSVDTSYRAQTSSMSDGQPKMGGFQMRAKNTTMAKTTASGTSNLAKSKKV